MTIWARIAAWSMHTKVAAGMFAIGAAIAVLILTVHYQGLDSRVENGGDPSMELGELWVAVGFFMLVAPAVVLLHGRWLRRKEEREATPRRRARDSHT